MIIRRRHTANYTTIGNVLFEDQRLAADEVGILAFLLSRPHDWEVRRPALMRRWGIGITAMKRIVNNWMRTGWCHAEKTRLPNGQFFIVYEIRDQPGKELSDDEIREALSLVSSEGSDDLSQGAEDGENHPHVSGEPPPCDPLVATHTVAGEGVAYKDRQNNELPKDDSDQKNEREYARAREKHATNLQEFKRRYPTAVSDDQVRIGNAWFALAFDEGDAALTGIPAFLERLKRDKRDKIPAGFTYLEQKRWTLLEQPKAEDAHPTAYAKGSPEAKAIGTLFEIAGKTGFFHQVYFSGGNLHWKGEVTPQLLALAGVKPRSEWVTLNRNQAGAWEHFLREWMPEKLARSRLSEGACAPELWPPRKDGTWSPTGPPDLMTDQDFSDFK